MEIKKLKLFEIILIILAGVFLYFYIENSSIGRFQLLEKGNVVIDSKIGQYKNVNIFKLTLP